MQTAASRARTPRPPTSATLPGGGTYLRPIRFIGHAGDARSPVELWETTHLFIEENDRRFKLLSGVAFIAAYSRKLKMWVGTMDMRLVHTHHNVMVPSCAADLERVGARTDLVFQIAGASLDHRFWGKRIGIAMYIAAAALAASKGGFGIAGDACFDSQTSDAARRVWKSADFRKHVRVGKSGLVAAMPPRSPGLATGRAAGATKKLAPGECVIVAVGENGDEERLDTLGLDLWDATDAAEKIFKTEGINVSRAEEVVLAAVCNRKIIGAATLGTTEPYEFTFSVAIDKTWQKRNLGRALVAEVEKLARQMTDTGHGSFRVWVVNPNMARLLESMGYDAEGRHGWTPDSPHMTKDF